MLWLRLKWMTLGEHQGAALQGPGAKEIPKIGRAGPLPAGAGPTTPSEEGRQAKGAARNPGCQAPPWDEVGLKLGGEEKFMVWGHDRVLSIGMTAVQLQRSSGRAMCKSLSLKQLPRKCCRSPHS